jgi:hypothetical protein
MTIVLQDPKTSLYLDHESAWTKRWWEAKNFSNSDQAFEFLSSCNLRDVQIVLKFPELHCEVVLQKPAILAVADPLPTRVGEEPKLQSDRPAWANSVIAPMPLPMESPWQEKSIAA